MIRLWDLPQREITRHLEAPIWLPVNPVEYHGPHLSLHNDRLLSLGMAQHICATRGWSFVVAEDLEVGVGPTPGPGSRFTPFEQVRALVVNACQRLADLGARRVVLMTFHGDPLHNLAINAGVRALQARGVRALAPFNQLLSEMLTLNPDTFAHAFVHIAQPQRNAMIREMAYDFHAGFFETSLSLHYAPHSVSPDYRSLPACAKVTPAAIPLALARLARRAGAEITARELEFTAQALGWHKLRPFPGYTGSPHLATPEAGAIFAGEIEKRFAQKIEDVLFAQGEGPAPIMGWLQTLTLNGRLT